MSLNGGRHPIAAQRVALQTARGVTQVDARGDYAYLTVRLPAAGDRAEQELAVYRTLAENGFSINLVRLHRESLSFITDAAAGEAARSHLAAAGFDATVTGPVSLVTLHASEMRLLCGVMARIARALLDAGIPMLQTGDGPDTAFLLVPKEQADAAVAALRHEFGVRPPGRPILVQKFGGRCVATAEARQLAAERVRRAHQAGFAPVVVVSAIGRRGEPYATDTLLEHLENVAPGIAPPDRERDLLLACGEIISTVIMTQTLKALGLRARALTGGQAGIVTDRQFGDAQIIDIDPSSIHDLFARDEVDVVVVGSGLAGLFAALHAAPHGRVALLSKDSVDTSNSMHAQGGIAAALSPEDSPQLHVEDTLRAGCGLCDPAAVETLAVEGPVCVRQLLDLGVPFDVVDGELDLGLEGGHSRRRIVHARGAATGLAVTSALAAVVARHPNVSIHEQTAAVELLKHDDRCVGVLAHHAPSGAWRRFAPNSIEGGRTRLSTGKRHAT